MVTAKANSALSTRRKEVQKKLSESLGGRLERMVALAPHTSFGIGGKADFFFEATSPEELVSAVTKAQKLKLRFFILGGGSNILVSDPGFRGLVIKNRCERVLADENRVTCQSGAVLDHVVKLALEHSLSGLEFAAGIPGTVGGAIRGNAGAFSESVGQLLSRAVILTQRGEIKQVTRDYFGFAYRESRLKQTGDVLLSATLELEKTDREEIARRIESNLNTRKERLPWQEKSAGCFFKNIIDGDRKIAAGFLLDQIGAKGMQEGGAKVSAKHANVLVNCGDASAADIRKLAERLKRKVRKKFDIALLEEVVYIN